MPESLDYVWKELLHGVAALEAFPFDSFTQRLHNKVRYCFGVGGGYADVLRPYIDKASDYPPGNRDSENAFMLEYQIYDLLSRLSIPSTATAVANYDGKDDPENLRACVSRGNSKERYLESITNLMGFCLGEHIDFQLKAQGRRGLIELYNIEGFKEYALKQINDPHFITIEINNDIARDNHLFSISFLMLADFFDNREFAFRNAPASGPDFQNKASYKALNQWSSVLWEHSGKGNPDKMDKIVEFCGRVATIGLCPLNSATGLQRPSPVSTTMKLFYNMSVVASQDGDYPRDLRDSLSRLHDKEEIINEWKSYCNTLSKSWEMNIQGKWNTAFYRAFQDGRREMIKFWETHIWGTQKMQLKWTNYLPVIKDPYNDFSQFSGLRIPIGTPITLADRTERPVESISPGDRILTHTRSQTSVPVNQISVHEPGKVNLVGFNGEPPSIPSSQVFHTPTGLRAVDVKTARTHNPCQHIGTLAVGHIVHRLQGGEYMPVEIKSIWEQETTLDHVYCLQLPQEQHTLHLHGWLVDNNNPNQTLHQTIEVLRKVPGSKRLSVLAHCQELQRLFQKFDGQCINDRLNWELFGRHSSPDGQSPTERNAGKRLLFDDYLNAGKALSRPVGAPVEHLTRGFCLTPHDPSRLPAGYELPTLTLVDGYLLLQDEGQPRSKYNSQDRSFRWTRELQDQKVFEHGVIEIYPEGMSGTGVVHLSTVSDAQSAPTRDQVHTFKATARDLQSLRTDEKALADQFLSIGKYRVTLDRSVWPPDTVRDEPEDPVDGGTLEQGYWKSPGGHKTAGLRLPLVDQLRDQINTKYNQSLGDFYKVMSRVKSTGELEFTIVFSRAPLIPFVSDAGLDVGKTFQVGFKPHLDVDITLPALYQQMKITFDIEFNGFSGHFFKYDPGKRGYKGDRHFIKGTSTDSEAVATCRSKASNYYASVFKPGDAISMYEMHEPAPVTKSLLRLQKSSVDDLLKFTTYDEKELHNASQGFIQKMMLYHMDNDQREKILREPKPSVPHELPTDLADNLEGKLKVFFKEKYAPAFICRYVGRTQKYSSSFTDQEIKNLWYWWEGNGPNSLSRSVEYNDINRMASRGAMLLRYEEKLEPYLRDDPDKWAKELHHELIHNKKLLLNWVHSPFDGKNNLINKQCNILDALSPSKDWAKTFFDEFMAFALKNGVEISEIEDGDVDKIYQWVQDSMKQLIMAILTGDDKISADVRNSLMQDISEFEKQNGLNQQADAAERVAAIWEKSSQVMREMAGWMSSIGKGLQAAFGGTAMFKWFGKAFDKIATKFTPSVKAVTLLKGIGTISTVAISLLSAATSIWALVENWKSMSDGARATVIIEATRMVVDAAGKAVDAFKSFKAKPSTNAMDELNTQVLNDSLSETITENTEKLGGIAQEIAGKEDYHIVMGENLHENGVPIEAEPKEGWNEELSSIAEDVPPGYEEAASKFNISGNLLRILNAILGIGLVVAMSFSLAHDWNSLSDTGKVLGVLNVVVQGLIVLLDIINIGADVGIYAITGAMSVALPILGAVLAIIGVALMIVQLVINFYIARQPPPDPIMDFINNKGHALIKTFDPSPQPQLTYSISETEVGAGNKATIIITGVNNSPNEVTVSHANITLYSGNDDVCLFRSTKPYIELLDSTHPKPDDGKNGYTYVTSSDLAHGHLPEPAKLGNTSDYYQYNLKAAGPPRELSTSLKNLTLKQYQKFQSVWTAVVNSKGEDSEKSTSWVELVEVGLKDKCQQQFMLKRV